MMVVNSVYPTVKHTLKYSLTTSNGVPGISMCNVLVDDHLVLYCDANTKSVEPKEEWMKLYLKNNPDQLIWYSEECLEELSRIFKDRMNNVIQRLNQSGGTVCPVHFCELR